MSVLFTIRVPLMARVARCNYHTLPVNCIKSVIFLGYSGFLHQYNWSQRLEWNIVEEGPNTFIWTNCLILLETKNHIKWRYISVRLYMRLCMCARGIYFSIGFRNFRQCGIVCLFIVNLFNCFIDLFLYFTSSVIFILCPVMVTKIIPGFATGS